MNLFVYGSLMFPEVWEKITGLTSRGLPATLQDYAAHRIHDQSYPALIPVDGAVTRGILYTGLDAGTLRKLDDFEGGFYQRVEVSIQMEGKSRVPAWTYRAGSPEHPDILSALWDAQHFVENELRTFLQQDPGFSGDRS